MPKQTFFNLPESKRQALVEVAIDEFARHGYRGAAVGRIAERAGIAKGSLYQYFADKRDLFGYLLDLATQEKLAVLRQMPPEPGMDFFTYLRWLAAAAGRATLVHPRLAVVGYRAYYGDLPFRDEVIGQAKAASYQFVEQLVRKAIAEGDIDPRVDPEMAVFVVNTLIAELGNFVLRRLGLDPAEVGREGHLDFEPALVEKVIDDLAWVLQFGLASPARRGAVLPTSGANS
ncbi:MAG: TetR/AcrR family transcriptional regulator [Chloroflexota bacterium]